MGGGWHRERGYSLIELMVVMAVLSVLAVAVLPLAELTRQRDRERELRAALWEIRDAIDAHKRAADTGVIAKVGDGYPESLEVLTRGVPRVAGGARMYFLRRIPADPFAPPTRDPAKSWGLRSYASGPERPEAGADVYDVFSRSERVGLNGMPLRQW